MGLVATAVISNLSRFAELTVYNGSLVFDGAMKGIDRIATREICNDGDDDNDDDDDDDGAMTTNMVVDAPIFKHLLPWEERSIYGPSVDGNSTINLTMGADNSHVILEGGECAPPPGMASSNKCCIGSISAGGQNIYNPQSVSCALGPKPVEKTRRLAMDLLFRTGPLRLLNTTTRNGGGGSKRQSTNTNEKFNRCDVCRIVDFAMKRKLNIAFTGDSLQVQIWEAFHCELLKWNYTVNVLPGVSRKQVFWRRGVMGIQPMLISSDPHNSNNAITADGMDSTPGSVTMGTTTTASTIEARLYGQYLPLEGNMSEIHEIADWADILIVNFGLHIGGSGDVAEYRKVVQEVLGALQRTPCNTTLTNGTMATTKATIDEGDETNSHNSCQSRAFPFLAWRETSAQHFVTPTGEWRDGVHECIPHQQSNYSYGSRNNRPLSTSPEAYPPFKWREAEVLRVAKEELGMEVAMADENLALRKIKENSCIPERETNHHLRQQQDSGAGGKVRKEINKKVDLFILPFADFSSKLYDVHSTTGDCSHFCHNPFVWAPLWRSIRLGLDYQEEREELERKL